jgi:formylglycine-generating enzyme required for sulfatase activity
MIRILIFLILAFPLSASPDMVLIKGGYFVMGDRDRIADSDARPAHRVFVRSLMAGRFEVTVQEFREFLQSTGYRQTGGGLVLQPDGTSRFDPEADSLSPGFIQSDTDPVVMVSFTDCAHYCNRLSEVENIRPYYRISNGRVRGNTGSDGYRLPTEAEWEYTARGGDRSQNFTYSGSGHWQDVAWTRWNSGEVPHPPGQLAPNEAGCYDMSGNVSELCGSFFYRYRRFFSQLPRFANPSFRIVRGGHFYEDCSHAFMPIARARIPAEYRSFHTGFRVFRSCPKSSR